MHQNVAFRFNNLKGRLLIRVSTNEHARWYCVEYNSAVAVTCEYRPRVSKVGLGACTKNITFGRSAIPRAKQQHLCNTEGPTMAYEVTRARNNRPVIPRAKPGKLPRATLRHESDQPGSLRP